MSYKALSPMKYLEARTAEQRMVPIKDPNFVLTLKKDGASYFLCKDLDSNAHLYSGNLSKTDKLPIDKIENVPHLKDLVEKFFPPGSMFLGEVCSYYDWKERKWYDHSASKRVTSILGSKPPLAIRRQEETKPVEFYLFDLMFWDNEDWFSKDFGERHARLEELYAEIHDALDKPEWLTITKLIKENKEETLAEWFAAGEEGGVLYRMETDANGNADYVTRSLGSPPLRRDHGIKIKTLSTFDVVIMGAEAPKKEYNGKYGDTYEYRDEDNNPVNKLWALGLLGALAIGCYDEDGELVKIGRVSSGLSETLRKEITDNLEDYIGRVIEVRCMSADSENGTLRHAVFERFRDDKDAIECTDETVFGQFMVNPAKYEDEDEKEINYETDFKIEETCPWS